MKRDLPHLVSAVFNTPHLIRGEKLDVVLKAVGNRILAGDTVDVTVEEHRRDAFRSGAARPFENGGYLADSGIAVLPVLGTLVRRGSWLDSMSGMMSYARISASVREMMDAPTVRGLMLEIDSHGGEAGGCFDLVRSMREMGEAAGKPIWAFVNETAASAGYAIASAAEKIWIPTTGYVGSIGVVAAVVDLTEADKKSGIQWTFVYAGDRKLDGNPHVKLSAGALSAIREDVADLYGMFVELVAGNRPLTGDAIRSTQAAMYRGVKAVDAGLADSSGTFSDAMSAFADRLDRPHQTAAPRCAAATDQQRNPDMKNRPGRQAHSPKASADQPGSSQHEDGAEGGDEDEDEAETDGVTTAPAPAPKSAKARASVPLAPTAPPSDLDAVAAERARCAELNKLATQAQRLGVTFDASKAIAEGLAPSACREQILEQAAAADEARETVTASTTHTTSESNAKATIRSGQDRAIERYAARHGLALKK